MFGFTLYWAALAGVGLVIIYTFLIWYLYRDKSLNQRQADSCYLLGFIYTLIALMASLHQMSLQSSVDITQIGQLVGPVLGDIAFALSTTIFGLAARVVLLTQVPPEVEQVEKEMQKALQSKTRTFMINLDLATNKVKVFIRGLDKLPNSADIIKKWQDDFNTKLANAQIDGRAISDMIIAPFRQIETEIQTSLNEFSTKLRGSLTSVIDSIQNIDMDTTPLQAAIDKVETSVKPLTASMSSLNTKTADLANNMGNITATTEKFSSRVGQIESQLNGMSGAVKNLEHDMNNFQKNMSEFTSNIKKFSDELADQAKEASDGRSELASVIEQHGTKMKEASNEFITSFREAAKHLNEYKKDLDELYANLAKASKVLAKELADIPSSKRL